MNTAVDGKLLASPLYAAVTGTVPICRFETCVDATPFTRVMVPQENPLDVNVTVPVTGLLDVTVAVMVEGVNCPTFGVVLVSAMVLTTF